MDKPEKTHSHGFGDLAAAVSDAIGQPWAFGLASASVIVWAISGPVFGFSDTWQLVINTGTTVLTFLIVFLIQHAQNRDAHATHLKLDELIRAMGEANNLVIDAEDDDDETIARLKKEIATHKREHSRPTPNADR